MDIFSEPGVMKAYFKMTGVGFGASAAPTALPSWMVDTTDGSDIRAYIIAGAKVLESTDGTTWNLFLTNANGANLGLGIYNGRVWYASATQLGYAPVGNAAAKNDSFQAIDSDTEFHPMIQQGGTLKFGAGRYVGSVNEAFTVTTQALKLVSGARVKALAEYLTKLFMGTRFGAMTGSTTYPDASVFDWRGTVLASGSALPDTPYPLKMLGMNALHYDGARLLGFPGAAGDIYAFDGTQFLPFRRVPPASIAFGQLVAKPGAVCQSADSVLFSGEMNSHPGVYQLKNGALCQLLVPSVVTPGETGTTIHVGFIKASFSTQIIIGYYKQSDTSYHIERIDFTTRQNSAMARTLWHRLKTDRPKRWYGVKLNLKPLASGCSVAVGYRTSRDAAFTDSGYTISSTNQDKPVMLAVQPRSREIQFKFTYTTTTGNTPELLSYDPLYEVLTSNR